jgi:hypothetical protein
MLFSFHFFSIDVMMMYVPTRYQKVEGSGPTDQTLRGT